MKKTSKSTTPPAPAASVPSPAPTPPSAPKKTSASASVAGTPVQEPRAKPSQEPRGKSPESTAPVSPPRAAAAAPQAPSAAAALPAKVIKPVKAPIPDRNESSASKAGGATVIRAKIDVGFGNGLFVRGEGGSDLSWDKGVPLANTSADEWVISLREVKRPVQFKLLINDQQWSSGDDYTVAPGDSVTLTPSF